MRYPFFGLTLLLSLMSVNGARAQALADTGGVFIGLRLNGSAWSVDIEADTDNAVGLAVLVGYGLSDRFSPYADLTAASLDGSDSYGLVHLDAGIRYIFAEPVSTFRPYADLALTVRKTEWNDPELGEVKAWGMGGTVGGGFLYFLAAPVALDVGFKATFGGLDNVQIGTGEYPVEIAAKSGRLNVGFTLFLNR